MQSAQNTAYLILKLNSQFISLRPFKTQIETCQILLIAIRSPKELWPISEFFQFCIEKSMFLSDSIYVIFIALFLGGFFLANMRWFYGTYQARKRKKVRGSRLTKSCSNKSAVSMAVSISGESRDCAKTEKEEAERREIPKPRH